ncbi:trypsin-like cysteine/serine peptidase domain-containing protein [Halteromyces radiatus]|uniref:trypsin-like cysteine/serine peptidase domain-containing protein n=1 Tax=Halteromyces radiatus TaxID=101107 RepID=UPI002220F1C0|nr:trypsin-like cysteine/serine peptidase domain-containing protein [Halteromyces radiatus]KAI8089508.1 trypsin-like cysteine/serine peptidase domain-containing protein [Halteromyces radiatus]
MEESQHPLTMSPSPRGDVSSPAPNQVDNVQSNLRAHRDSLTHVVTHYEQSPPFNHSSTLQQPSAPFPRGRSKSLAYDMTGQSLLHQLPVDFWGPDPRFSTGIPYKAKTWEPTLEKAIKAIISIKASHVRSFDTETSGAYTATGFIVDAQQGIVLTNRHVVSPAPIVAQAVLTNYEEVDLMPIYRDPVHDFGFMQFDPSKIKFMELEEIELSPERAKVGLDIRVVGNDAGEKLSILAGTLARLDRRAPEYGVGEYNDFNTFYLQAASGTSGGSSGSPVLDIDGHAVALNAGGASRASSSYYLPLDRVQRALNYIRRAETVPRATLQTEFEYLPYNEVRRLGLKAHVEEKVRTKFPDETGMLVVRSVLPEGPADKKLVAGDIVIGCNGKMVPHFIALFGILDDAVGEVIKLTISRGKKIQDVELTVQDLHSITPATYCEIGGGIVHDLSYQLAKSYSQPVGGVYVATSGHMLASASAWRKSIITSVNNVPTPNLAAFIDAMNKLPDGARVPLRFYSLHKAYKDKVMIMHVDRHWHPFRLATRNDLTGVWDYKDMPPPPSSHLAYAPSTASFPPLDTSLALAEKVMPSFVAIDFYLPYLVDGMKATQFYGTGYVVSLGPRPLIICDRDTIPISLGDVFITFANSIIIPGKLVLLHPFYNYALITYDPSLIGDTPIKPLEFSDVELNQGDETHFVGISSDHSTMLKKVTVASISNIGTRECSPPRWRAMNVEGIKIDENLSTQGGLLTTSDGLVQALWVSYSSQNEKGKDTSFMSGLSSSLIQPTLQRMMMNDHQPMIFKGLDAEFWTMRLAAARTLGLSEEWIKKLEQSGSKRYTLLYVLNILDERSALSDILHVGDIILTMQGKLVTRMTDLTTLQDLDTVRMVILRDGKEMQVDIPLSTFSDYETTEVIGWQGALIQRPYKAVLEQVRNVPTGVYVSCTLYGSPASNVLRPGVWIVEVQGQPVHDLDDFLQVVHTHELETKRRRRPSYIPPVRRASDQRDITVDEKECLRADQDNEDDDDNNDEGYIRIKTISRNDIVRVVALKLDLHYWNTWRLQRDDSTMSGWMAINA